jgi:hypothetical protein
MAKSHWDTFLYRNSRVQKKDNYLVRFNSISVVPNKDFRGVLGEVSLLFVSV